MNKNIKRIIAVALAISAFSIIEPTKYINLTNTVTANADARGADLKSISLGRGNIDFKGSKTEYTLTLDSSIKELKITATPKYSDSAVEINGTKVSDIDGYKKIVNLDKGENTINIKIQNGSRKKTYTLTVIRGQIEAEKQIYLSDIELSEGNINFSKETTSYDIDVKSEISKISIKAKPEDEDYDVEIDEVTVNNDDNYKKTVSLNNGNNEIKIKIDDTDDHEKVYTLNINRGGTSTTNTSTSTPINGTSNTNPTTSISKGWVLNNGQWNYINEKGNKDTGWKQINSIWYYLDTNGIMKTGWQNLSGEWYYLDTNGVMKIGWLKNSDGKWYYLYNSGAMAKNATISGYKLGANGAWIL